MSDVMMSDVKQRERFKNAMVLELLISGFFDLQFVEPTLKANHTSPNPCLTESVRQETSSN
jgi:hypothetical protein